MGKELIETGDVKGAIENFQKAIAIDPNFLLAHFDLANALTKSGDAKGSIEHYHRVIEINPL